MPHSGKPDEACVYAARLGFGFLITEQEKPS
jgi:hypothetical protein